MSELDPFEPPQSDLSGEKPASPGSTGFGIFLAILLLLGGMALFPLIPVIGCMGGPLCFAAGIVTAYALGKPKTAKGLWIGLTIFLGLLILAAGTLWVVCGGAKL